MKLNISNFIGHSIINNNKQIGKIIDVIYDEKKWICRYFEVHLEKDSHNQHILLPFELIVHTDWINEKIEFAIPNETIAETPRIEKNQEIRRKLEIELSELYKTSKYWETKYVDSMSNPTRWAPDRVIVIDQEYRHRVPTRSKRSDDRVSRVRRLTSIKGFETYALDGSVGTLQDLITDNKKWEIISFVVRTYNSTGSIKDVLVASQMIKEISYPDRGILVNMNKSEIHLSPDFQESLPINEQFVVKRFDFTGKPK